MAIEFIQLNRTFSSISKDQTFDEDTYDFLSIFGQTGSKIWDDLLKLPRVIILAEAGAGKTQEMKAIARRLHDKGKAAFFFRLEHLGSDFEIAFDETGTLSEFDTWVNGDETGWFFLDSVDEARLQSPHQFESAIKRLAIKLGDHKQRAHILITSRVSEWQPQSDFSFIKTTLPFIEPEIFALCPLDQNQRRTLAQAFGVPDTETFLTAVERADADIFAGRPQDFIELIDYWKTHKKIENLLKLIENSITTKLVELDPKRDRVFPLNPQEARCGVEMLAAAVVFSRKTRILIPDQGTGPGLASEAIDVRRVLNWKGPQISALLQRPVFDKAIYGCVRFHERRVREYLTASWLNRLLKAGKSRREIEGLFFKERYGQDVLVPSLRPVLSWLILFDDGIREKAIKIAPEICMDGGDSSALPIELRKQLLEHFCRRYATQTRWGLSFDLSDVRRFADPGLGETINHLLETYRHHEKIRVLLLEMVWQKEIRSCAEKALAFALDETNDSYTRRCAIRSVRVAGSKNQKEPLAKTLLADTTMRDKILTGKLISAFAPDHLSTQDVLKLVERLPAPDELTIEGHPASELREYSRQQCPQDQLFMWCKGLLVLLEQAPFIERRHFEVSQKYGWLLSFAALAVERLVRAKHPDALQPPAIKIISLTQHAVHYRNYSSKEHQLEKLVPEWPELNHALFWFDVASERHRRLLKNQGDMTDIWHVNFPKRYWHFNEGDFQKVLSMISEKSNLDDRLVALSLAFRLYREAGRGPARRRALKKVVQGVTELEEKLHLLLNPPPMSEESKRDRREDANFDRQQKRQEKKAIADRKRSCEWLQTNTHVLRDTSNASTGGVQNGTVYLLNNLREKKDNNDSWSEPHWEALIPEFGQEVAEAYRDGCVDYWRKYSPKVRSEGIENPNSIPYAVTVGLSGIEIESDLVAHWPTHLSGEEAECACRYALYELNGFPKWLSKLHAVFPNAVEKTLMKEIAWEFSQYDGNEPCHYVLSDVSYRADWLKPKIAKQVVDLLRDHEPKHDDTLEHALRIMVSAPHIEKTMFSEIAETNIKNSSSLSRKAIWLAAWMYVEAEGAVEKLKTILNNEHGTEGAKQFSILFMVTLLGNGRDNVQRVHQDFIRPKILLSLIKLMRTYIPVSEDIDIVRKSDLKVGLRENAQDARNRLFGLLNNIPGKATYDAMLDLSTHADSQVGREWYAISAKRRAETDAEGEPWRPEDITDFAKDAERAPQNHRELFELGVSRLLDLKADLEDGDTSIAGLLQKADDETQLRNFIGSWLRDRSKGWYSVPQEDELTDGTRPDLRIYGIEFDSPLPVELKIGENWSGSELFERLHNQLCGQYLRDARSNCGIYLLVYRGREKSWAHPNTKERLNFNSLIKSLETEARSIVSNDNKIESLEVIGIDLKKRMSSKIT